MNTMQTQVTKFLAIDKYGQQYTLEHHAANAPPTTQAPTQSINDAGHFEWKGSRVKPLKNNVFHLPKIATSVFRFT
jgi:hypothetical protein